MYNFNTKVIGLRDLRIIKGLNISSAAKMIGIEKQDLIKYEDDPGDTPVLVAIKIASVYNYDYDYIAFSNDKNPTR